ncbi:dipeptide ABC transporter ATP-binding protein [Actinomadura viridis]|uniref:dipeptide ABC transporter ATP-binding protein n=1 Tax=Actinomadura viridis TaxID=58110 RepID=UPI00367B363C
MNDAPTPTVLPEATGPRAEPPGRPAGAGLWRRFRRRPLAVGGLAVFGALLLVSFAGPAVWPYDPQELAASGSGGPSWQHPFGTDELGHDWLALVLRGSRRSIQIALTIALVSMVVGTLWGAIAGLHRGRIDAVMMRVTDLALMLPLLVVGAVLAGDGGGSWWLLGLILGGLLSPVVARVVRAQVLSLREREFVLAARAQGASRTRIIVRHLLPNVAGTVIVAGTLAVAAGVLAETSLSYLGFGVRPPDTSLGLLISDSAVAATTRPWLFYSPGAFILLIALSVNFVGDGLRDALDPRRTTRVRGRDEEGTTAPRTAPGSPEGGEPPAGAVLTVTGLSVRLISDEGVVHAVRGVDWSVAAGEAVAIVGESGSGKSATALAVMGLLPRSARVGGSVRLRDRELLGAGDRELSSVRGKRVSLIPQDPQMALNPAFTVGDQIAEVIRAHNDVSRREARAAAVDLLRTVGIGSPEERARQYPHELSGGMRQRVVIAVAMANDPDVIIADEPTTALDVTVQEQVLEALRLARAATGAALVLITHDLGVAAGAADRVLVMYAGRVVESGPTEEVFTAPRMPYTAGLIGSLPRVDRSPGGRPLTPIGGAPPSLVRPPRGCAFAPRCPLAQDACRTAEPPLGAVGPGRAVACLRSGEAAAAGSALFPATTVDGAAAGAEREADRVVLEVRELTKTFTGRGGVLSRRGRHMVYAVRGVSFELRQGETLAIAGESGCGKSTLARVILGLEPATGGSVLTGGDATGRRAGGAGGPRTDLQIVFQDPFASLDPRMPVRESVAEPLRILRRHDARGRARVEELLRLVGLDPADGGRYPHEFSGGQRQRIAIARALAPEPSVLILDEPTSALDASVQAGVLNLLRRLQRETGVSYLFISHDLAVIRHVADRVAVMYLGRVVESAPAQRLFETPLHPYTRALVSAARPPDPRAQRARPRVLLEGEAPSAMAPPRGCPFRSRCPRHAGLSRTEQRLCAESAPPPAEREEHHVVACHYPGSPGAA